MLENGHSDGTVLFRHYSLVDKATRLISLFLLFLFPLADLGGGWRGARDAQPDNRFSLQTQGLAPPTRLGIMDSPLLSIKIIHNSTLLLGPQMRTALKIPVHACLLFSSTHDSVLGKFLFPFVSLYFR